MKANVLMSQRGSMTAEMEAEKYQSIEPKNLSTLAVTKLLSHPSKERATRAIVRT